MSPYIWECFQMSFVSSLFPAVYVSSKVNYIFALQRPLIRAKLISINLWEFYQGNYFFDCFLTQFLISYFLFPAIPTDPHPRCSAFFFFFCSLPSVDGNTWAQVIALYPTLVECITCSSSEVSSALKEALGPFKDFMQPPISRVQNGES